MNIAIFVGVMLEKPVMSDRNATFATFRMASIEEGQTEAVYFNCIATGSMCYKLYSLGETGKCFLMRGRILYNKEKKSNYIEVTMYMDLTPSTPLVPLSINEFLDIYKPDKILENLRDTERQQRKEMARSKSNVDDIPPEEEEQDNEPSD